MRDDNLLHRVQAASPGLLQLLQETCGPVDMAVSSRAMIKNINILCYLVTASAMLHVWSRSAFVQPITRASKHGDLYKSTFLLAKKKRKKSTSKSDSYSDDDAAALIDLVTSDNGKTYEEYLSSEKQSNNEPMRTFSGGPSLIFEMARRMLVWDDELYQGLNDASHDAKESKLLSTNLSNSDGPTISTPRWRPSPLMQKGISNVNPSFRTSSPIMTSAGYAGILRRNSRKKMKPSMWRHALRVYDKMADLEKITIEGDSQSKKKAVRRKTVHYEAALVAASKLAMWEEAIKIFRTVEEMPQTKIRRGAVVGIGDGSTKVLNHTHDEQLTSSVRTTSAVTDNMILSVISACIKGSKVKRTANRTPNATTNVTSLVNATASQSVRQRGAMRLLSLEERRQPLDEARRIVFTMEVSCISRFQARTANRDILN